MIGGRGSRSPKPVLSAVLVVALLAGVLGPGLVDPAAAKRGSSRERQGFANTTPITISEGPVSQVSTIAVSGFETEIADVDVTLDNINHARASDMAILLVGPDGQSAVILCGVGGSANDVTLILDDKASNQVPRTGSLVNGVYQPTNFRSPSTWFPPAPASPPSGSELGVFNNTDPNGIWSLFLLDTLSGTVGALSGWSLHITSANGVPNAAPDSFSAKAGKQLIVASGVLTNDGDPDGDLLTAILGGQPKKGQVELQPDGAFTYRSSKKARGADSFTYLARDATGLSDLETVTITIKKARKKGKK